jgi:hypothetical protein
VCAVSLARGRKGQDFRVTTRTDATGRFALEVPVSERRREAYMVWVQLDDYVQFGAVETIAVADETIELRAAMRRWATDVAGAWQLELTLRDPTGAPLADAQVDVHRRQPERAGRDLPTEVHARTDAAGRAVLRGTHRGEKLLRVRAKARGLAPLTHTLAITEPGPHALEFTLAQGRAVAGVVRAAADGSPIAGLMITAEQVPQGEHGAEEIGFVATDTEGRFRIEGCGAGPVRLSGHGEQWSRFVAEGFTPDEEQIELAMKRRGDPTARGMHLGEIHGRVTDAASGRDVDVSRWDLDLEAVPPEVVDWRSHVLAEVLNPRPVQRSIAGPIPPPSPVFCVDDLPAGRYVVVVRQRGHAPSLAGPFEVGPGRLVHDVVIALAAGGTVTATVRDANGPVAKACVWVSATADPTSEATSTARALAGGDRYPTHRYSLTDAQGRLRLEHVPAGVTLRCVAADGEAGIALSAPFVLENDRAHAIDLQLTR